MTMLCHKVIRKIAKEIAGAAYEILAKDNTFHEAHPSQGQFINTYWKTFIVQARQSILDIIAGEYSDVMKEEAMEIFMQEKTLDAVNKLSATIH